MLKFPPTPKQKALLQFIGEFMRENDCAPTFSEMCAGINISSRGRIHEYLDALEERGWIKRLRGRQRAIVLIDD